MHEPQDGETSSMVSRYAGQGVSERMLSRVETEYGLCIPPTYRAFLSLVGNNPQAVPDWVGSDWTGDCLSSVQAGARDLVRNNPHLNSLPEEAFVLLLHQGYSLLFVHAGLGDGSPVYAYAETDEPDMRAFREVAPTLDALMLALIPEVWQDARALARHTSVR